MYIPIWLLALIVIGFVLYFIGLKSNISTFEDNVQFERKRHASYIDSIAMNAANLEHDLRLKTIRAMESYAIEILWNLRFRADRKSLDRASYFLDDIDEEINELGKDGNDFINNTELKLIRHEGRSDFTEKALGRVLKYRDDIRYQISETNRAIKEKEESDNVELQLREKEAYEKIEMANYIEELEESNVALKLKIEELENDINRGYRIKQRVTAMYRNRDNAEKT